MGKFMPSVSVIVAVIVGIIAYNMFIKKALKLDSFEEDFEYAE